MFILKYAGKKNNPHKQRIGYIYNIVKDSFYYRKSDIVKFKKNPLHYVYLSKLANII